MDPSLESHCDLGGMYTYRPASKCSSALTRLAKLVSPFQDCLKAVSPAVSRPPVVPHQPSRSPRHDQYEISGLISSLRTRNYLTSVLMRKYFLFVTSLSHNEKEEWSIEFLNVFNPRKLKKKLVNMICIPKMVSVAPGIN